MKSIFLLSLIPLIVIFYSCSEDNLNEDNLMKDDISNTSDSVDNLEDPREIIIHYDERLDYYFGEYYCCSNEDSSKEIIENCDSPQATKYTLSMEEGVLIFGMYGNNDMFPDRIDGFEFNGDTLVLIVNQENDDIRHYIALKEGWIYDGRDHIGLKGWVKDPLNNGWSIVPCDIF